MNIIKPIGVAVIFLTNMAIMQYADAETCVFLGRVEHCL